MKDVLSRTRSRYLSRYLTVQSDDELVAQRGTRLIWLLLVMSVADVLVMLSVTFIPTVPSYLAVDVVSLILFGLLYWYTRRGHRWPPFVFLGFLALIIPYLVQQNPQSPWALAIAIPIVMAPLVAASWLCGLLAVVEVAALYGFNYGLGSPAIDPMVIITLGILGMFSWLSSSSLENALKESRDNASALIQTNRELEANRALLETNARELIQRSDQLEAAAKVAQAATSILETDRLIRQVVEVIREHFGLYYVGLFLTDEAGEWAILRAATGEAGRAMLARGHRLKIGDGSMIGWCIAHSQARVAQEAGEDAVRLATPELPDTRSEAALPLRSRSRIIGALTVQSNRAAAFDEDTTVVLQTMGDQVAVALDNAHLFTEAEAALEAMARAYGEMSREGWSELVRVRPELGFLGTERGIRHVGGIPRSEIEQALLAVGGTAEHGPTTESGAEEGEKTLPLAVPIKARGNILGVLDTYKPSDGEEWTSEEIELMEALANQVGVALESARLYEDAQRRAFHERLVSEISDKMRRAVDMDMLMTTTIREISAALGTSEAFVQLRTPAERKAGGE